MEGARNVREVIDLVSDGDSSDVMECSDSGGEEEDSSDDVEVISDSNCSMRSSWNASPGVQVDIEKQPRSVFIKQLVQVVTVKQEPVANGYEPFTKNQESVTKSYEPISNGYEPADKSYELVNNGYKPVNNSYELVNKNYEPVSNGYESDTKSCDPVSNGYDSDTKSCDPVSNGYDSDTKSCEPYDPLGQVKSEVDPDVVDTQPRIEDATIVGQEDDCFGRGIQAVIAKLGVENTLQTLGEPAGDDVAPSRPGELQVPVEQIVEKDSASGKNEVCESDQPRVPPVFCGVCGRTFYDKDALQKHIRTHYVAHKTQCLLCGKMFRDKSRLSYHMLDHTGERPYRCDVCGSGFKILYHLQYHMFSHTDERPHACETCGRRYKQFCHLKQHRKKHDEFFTLKCPECGKIFHGAGTLKSHRYKHTGEWPHRCRVCSKGFSNLKWCEIHEAKHVTLEPKDSSSRVLPLLPGASARTACSRDDPTPPANFTLDASACESDIKMEVPELTEQPFPYSGFFIS